MKKWDKGRKQAPDDEAPGVTDYEQEDYEELDFEEDEEWQDEEEPEEDDGLGPWIKAALFLGMVVLAAIICAALWYFTHPIRSEEGGQGQLVEGDAGGETGQLPDSTGTGEPGQASDPAGASEEGRKPETSGESQGDRTSDPAGGEGTEKPSGGEGETGTGTDGVISSEAGGGSEASGDFSAEITDGENREPVQGTGAMEFSATEESVTPKDVVNLRSVPSTADDGNIVAQSQNGEVLRRVGVNQDTGWSKIEYNGETVYAVTQYLTADVNYKTQVQPSNPNRVSTQDGRVILFEDCDDWISPKEYVNLRTEPSTSEGNGSVSCQLQYKEKAHRTGYSADSGWSRVEYDGQILYVVTSLIYVVTEE